MTKVKLKNKKAKDNSVKSVVSRSYLRWLEIDANEEGFTIWVRERKKIGGKMRMLKHWVIDGSMLKKTGRISMGEPNMYKIEARYDAENNHLVVGRK